MGRITSQQALRDFQRRRRHAEDILGLKLYRGARSIRRLDEHAKGFHNEIKHDLKSTSREQVKGVTKEFEKELQAEIDKLISLAKADIGTLQKTMDEWTGIKRTLKGKDERYDAILETERRYAEVLTSSMAHRLDALNNSFHRLRKR